MHYRRVVRDCPVCGIADSAFLSAWPGSPVARRGAGGTTPSRAVRLWKQACECLLDRDADLYIQPCEHERKPDGTRSRADFALRVG